MKTTRRQRIAGQRRPSSGMYAILDRLTDTLDLPRERPDTHTSAADRIDAMKAAVGAADGKSPDEAKRLLTNPSRSNSNPH